MSDRLQRLWPSLVALVGTVAVVLALLWYFGDDTDDSTPDDVAAGDTSTEPPATDPPATEAPPETEAPPTDAPTEEPTEPAEPVTADPDVVEPLGVLNQTDEAGLEEQASERFQDGGWEVAAMSEFTGTVPETTVYVPEGMEEAADALVLQFPEIGRVMPTVEPFNDTRLVIVLADDYLDEVDSE
ncbi:LytR C-terminal domain-containing protein [Jiangella alkaliphila]|uniref:LytR cell envelope-related transcriptional attenuator n=1 Tax=Jiangella alkaliphila TaxID=419479 RepID=A0A1H2III1_9ACTN|nr:LytR C-terminal domain-containing protein [Jiangella alkaliphila]SDU43874.1 LytR cell envelope-related transcriptional attenuator [Jiangella alkaliphila]